MWSSLFECSHSFGFPRRWDEFQGNRNVDVQTCSKCGARRESLVQFGRLAQPPATPEATPVLTEVRA
jgi:hypothetical protein